VLHEAPGEFFRATCPTHGAPGNFIQMALGPDISSEDVVGCGLSGQPATWKYVAHNAFGTSADFPPATLIYPHASSDLVCETKNHMNDGDPKLFSWRTSADANFGADPTCAAGIASGNVCCKASCGTCGGNGCSSRSGGSAGCCGGTISTSARYCLDVGPPCIMADPQCRTGILSGNVCCAAGCGTCGGNGCGSRPGGAASCCGGTITTAALSCRTHMPPCIVD
jgi:hypothetical protein